MTVDSADKALLQQVYSKEAMLMYLDDKIPGHESPCCMSVSASEVIPGASQQKDGIPELKWADTPILTYL